MKKLICALALLCIAAGEGEIEGWKVFNGKWTGTPKNLHSSTGTIVWEQEANKSIEFSCTLCIKSFGAEGKGVVALFWGWPSDDLINTERNNLILFPQRLLLYDTRNPSAAHKLNYDWPLGKPIRLKGKILPNAGQIMVGRNTLTCAKLNGLGHFALHVNGADAEFSDTSVKMR